MKSFFVELQDFETVVVSGPDAAKFLQGQLTCDVHSLAENAFTRGAACNNKGRVFASFILARHNTDFHVLLAHGLASVFTQHLQKFIPFYKCSMQILPSIKSIGLSGTEAGNTLIKLGAPLSLPGTVASFDSVWIYNLSADNSQFILSTNEDSYSSLRSSIDSSIPEGTRDNWEVTNILSGHFPFAAEDVDKYTPQELHFDQAGYVSFSKGCYTGQEIVARMHYRGKMKRRLYLLKLENFKGSPNGHLVEIFDESGKNLGAPLKQIIADNQTLFALTSLPVELGTSLFTSEGLAFTFQPLTQTLTSLPNNES